MTKPTIVVTPDPTNVLCTKNIQASIDSLASQGGGTLRLLEGDYVLSTIELRSHVHIVLEKGARILGADDFYAFEQEEKIDFPIYQDSSHTYFRCAMFIADGIEDFSFMGEGTIDMRSVWDEDNVRDIYHRGPKVFSIKSSRRFEIAGLTILNATDLAVYFADCEDVEIHHLNLRVYIDGVSPDNSKNVSIHDCDIVAGDDCIVFKSCYNLNKYGECRNIEVRDCRLSSRCNAVKVGTETVGGFYDINVHGLEVYDTRLSVLALETVDGAHIDGFRFADVHAVNCNGILYATIGDRLRAPEGATIGTMRNVLIENVVAEGPYHDYDTIYWNYVSYAAHDSHQYLWIDWAHGNNYPGMVGSQFVSNLSGMPGHPIENLVLRNIHLTMNGAPHQEPVPFEKKTCYPEINEQGHPLPARGIFFADIDGLTLENVTVDTIHDDPRPDFGFLRVKKA